MAPRKASRKRSYQDCEPCLPKGADCNKSSIQPDGTCAQCEEDGDDCVFAEETTEPDPPSKKKRAKVAKAKPR
jgi:hypothetical protein